MGKFKDYKVGTRFVSEGQIIKVAKHESNLYPFACQECILFKEKEKSGSRCNDYACSYRIFKLSRLNKLIFWKKKINKK